MAADEELGAAVAPAPAPEEVADEEPEGAVDPAAVDPGGVDPAAVAPEPAAADADEVAVVLAEWLCVAGRVDADREVEVCDFGACL